MCDYRCHLITTINTLVLATCMTFIKNITLGMNLNTILYSIVTVFKMAFKFPRPKIPPARENVDMCGLQLFNW